MRHLSLIVLFLFSAFVLGCTTHSSGGGTPGGPQQEGQQGGGRQGGGDQGGRLRTTPWQCAIQFENGIVACGTYTSAASDEVLRQDCEGVGQVVATCPVNNFLVTCLIKVEGADIRFRMAGTPAQREEMIQLCRQNNGQVQR